MAPDPQHQRIRELAQAVRAHRRMLGLTQIDLGRFAGCGPDFIYDLEAGKPTIRLHKLLDVLGVLGLELHLVEGRRVLVVADPLRPPPAGPMP
jgi:y4mF family transcriptional regulator